MYFGRKSFVLVVLLVLMPANVWMAREVVDRMFPPAMSIVPETGAYRARVAMLTGFSRDYAGESPIVFVGDSLTHHCPFDELFPDVEILNRGISADTSTGLAARWDDHVTPLNPAKIFILIGVNDFLRGLDTDPAEVIRPLLEATPSGKIYVISVLPTSGKWAHLNEKIQPLNRKLQELALQNGHHWIDLHDKMSEDDGTLKPGLAYDGLHMTSAGYSVWQEYLRSYLER